MRVLPFLCNKERESVSMSALPKAQTSRFERDKKRERERDDDDDDVSSKLLCFCTHEKTRDPKRSPKRKKTKKKEIVFLTDIYYVMCVRIKEWGKSALDLCSPAREKTDLNNKRKEKPRPCLGFIFSLFGTLNRNSRDPKRFITLCTNFETLSKESRLS